jgi:hypothetical protein
VVLIEAEPRCSGFRASVSVCSGAEPRDVPITGQHHRCAAAEHALPCGRGRRW